ANVDPQILDFRNDLAFFGRQEMNRLAGDNARQGSRGTPDLNVLPNQHLGVPAADRLHPEKSAVVDMFDEQSNLIAMSGEHDPRRALRIDGGDHISMPVGGDRIRELRSEIPNQILNGTFVSGRTGSLQHRPEKMEKVACHGVLLWVGWAK